jgi:Protein of unknown function (DUF3237)
MALPQLPPPRLEFVFAAHVTVGEPLDVGDVGKGRRRIVPITGGEFSGPTMRGVVLGGGADWQIIRDDGVAELEARYTLQSSDGALVYVRHGPPEVMAALAAGREVTPGSYYFRGATFFETSVERYDWLTRHVIICTGHREPSLVKVEFYRID